MKTVLERPKSQLVTVMMLSFAIIVGFGLAARKRHIDLFDELANLIQTPARAAVQDREHLDNLPGADGSHLL